MTRAGLKQRAYAAIDKRSEEIIGLGEQIRKTPELETYVRGRTVEAILDANKKVDRGASGAREVLQNAKPPMTREQYLTLQRGIARREIYEG